MKNILRGTVLGFIMLIGCMVLPVQAQEITEGNKTQEDQNNGNQNEGNQNEGNQNDGNQNDENQKPVNIKELSKVTVVFKDGNKYTYTGKEIRPEVSKITFYDKNNTYQEMTEGFTLTYGKPGSLKEVGTVDVKLVIDGVEGEIWIEDAYSIVFNKATKLSASNVSYNNTKLTWSKVTGAHGYVIYRSTKKGETGKALKTITSGSTVSYNDKSVKIGTTYYYKIRAYRTVDGKRVYAGYSSQVGRTAQLPGTTMVSTKKSSYKQITVKWKKVSAASGYALYRSTSESGSYTRVATIKGVDKVTYKDTVPVCGKTYYYKVRPYRTYNKKNYLGGSTKALEGHTTPNTVQFNSNSASGRDYVKLRWDKSAGAKGYVIYRSTQKNKGFERIYTIKSAKTLSWTQKNLDEDTVYYYKVRGYTTVDGKNIYGSLSKPYEKIIVSERLESIREYTYVKYKSGGASPSGWDCSGFTKWALKYIYGVTIPKYSGDQAKTGRAIDKNDMSKWKPGDILVYKSGGRVNHVALYLGDGKLMHALSKKHGTIIQDVNYYEKWDKKNNLYSVRRCF